MNFTVLIAPTVKQTITSWNLSRALLLEVYDRLLVQLPKAPDTFLKERIVPLAVFAYKFVLQQDEGTPYRLFFLFAVDRDDGEKILHVVGCRLTQEEPGDN